MEAQVRTIGLVNGRSVDVYLLDNNEVVYSQRSLASSVDMADSNVRRFLNSERFKAIVGEGFNVRQVKAGRVYINAVPSVAVVAYWASVGAVELITSYAGAALDQLALKAFGIKQVLEQRAEDIYESLRDDHKTIHNALQSHCQVHHFQPWVVSKLIVEAVTGKPYEQVMDGVEYRKAWSPDIVSLEELRNINKVKREFVNCRAKTAKENVVRACSKARVTVKVAA